MLVDAGGASRNAALAKAIAAFFVLTPGMRESLVAAIEVVDGAPLIADMRSLIEERLRMIAPRGKLALAREQLEGWWWSRICAGAPGGGGRHDFRARSRAEARRYP